MASARGDRPAQAPGRSGSEGAGAGGAQGTSRPVRRATAPTATPPATGTSPTAADAPAGPPAADAAAVTPATPAGAPGDGPPAVDTPTATPADANGADGGRAGRIGRPRGPRRSRDERRAELLDAAERAIRRIGPQASMDELAAEAGITKPILYSHFGDKAGLAAALTKRVAAELDQALTASLSKVQHPEQVISSTVDAFCSFIEAETELYHFLWYAAMSQNQLDRSGSKVLISGFADQIAFALGSALRRVGADSGAAEPWSYAIIGMTLTAGEWWLERRTMTRDDLVAYLTQLLWGGLAGAGLDQLADLFDPAQGIALAAPDPAVVDLDSRRDG